jgi:hypothetical protein
VGSTLLPLGAGVPAVVLALYACHASHPRICGSKL